MAMSLIELCEEAQRLVTPVRRAGNYDRFVITRRDPIATVYKSMKDRCRNQNNPNFYRYGGRGIVVCERWLLPHGNGYRNFKNDLGQRPDGFTLERKDNDGPYSPDNCKWASHDDQYANRSSNRWLSHGGERRTLKQWSKILGIPYTTICNRYGDGLPAHEILNTKILWGKGKTHCKRGHEFTEINIYTDRRGSRHCRTCGKEVMRRLRERIKKDN